MNCPRCTGQTLAAADYHGAPAHLCPTCNGAWVNQVPLNTQIQKVVRTGKYKGISLPKEKTAKPEAAACPECTSPMYVIRYQGGLWLERCSTCSSLWLDEGDFDKICQVKSRIHWRSRRPKRIKFKKLFGGYSRVDIYNPFFLWLDHLLFDVFGKIYRKHPYFLFLMLISMFGLSVYSFLFFMGVNIPEVPYLIDGLRLLRSKIGF